MWIALAAVLILLPFLSLPGKYVFDTRDPLWFNPGAYLARAFYLWRSSPWLGHEQHDGIVVPMALIVWLLRSVGLSAWVAERIWQGMLLFGGAATTIVLVDTLRGRRTVVAPLVAGLVYSLTPYSFGYGLPFTGVYLPYVLLPLLLAITIRGVTQRGLLWPALFGLTMFLMGGGNGAPQVYVLLTAAALILWAVFVERTARFLTALRFGAWSLLFVIGLNAYWLFLLGSTEVTNALAFSEQPTTINISSSMSEAIRGLGFWQFYGGDQFGPWIPTVRTYVTSLPLILTGMAIPIGAFLSAWLVRWRYRLFFVVLAIVTVFVAGGVFPVSHPTPLGRALLWMYAHVPGAAGLRTTYKVTAQVNLSLAVLFAFGVEALLARLRSVSRATLFRAVAVTAVMAIIVSNAYPLWIGHLYNRSRGVGAIPPYWSQALDVLDERDTAYRAFFAPATSWPTYRWGAIKESIVATDPNLSAVQPLRLPVGQRYGSNLVAAIEQPYLQGLPATGSAELFRYLGVQDVVLQNDLDWLRSHTARPADLQALLQDPDLKAYATFGAPGQNTVPPGGSSAAPARLVERDLYPVQVLAVQDPLPIVRPESDAPVVISGDGFGLAGAARGGMLPGDPPILYSGTLSPRLLQDVLREGTGTFVVTDSNRRRVWYFTGPRAPHSYTLPAGQTIGGRDTGYLLFGDRADAQTVALYPGVRSITSSAYGSLFDPTPAFRPANAFDGDPSTWWAVGLGGDPTNSWIQAGFERPRRLTRVAIALPKTAQLEEIRRVRLGFSDGTSVIANVRRGQTTTITFPAHTTTFLRVRILSVGPPTGPGRSGAAIADIVIPGLHPAEILQAPSDLFDTAAQVKDGIATLGRMPLTYLFERSREAPTGQPDEEVVVRRRFEAPAVSPYALGGSVLINRSATDAQLQDAVLGKQSVHVFSSSSLFGSPAGRGFAAFDGSEATAWVPGGAVGEWVEAHFPKQTVGQVTIHTGTGADHAPIVKVSATFSDGSVVEAAAASITSGGITMRFPPRATSSVRITIQKVFEPTRAAEPVSITEVQIPGVGPFALDRGAPAPCTAEAMTIDGVPVRVRADGSVGALLEGRALPLVTCDGSPITLSSGWHDLVAGGPYRANTVVLATRGSVGLPPPTPALPTMTSAARPDGGFVVGVKDVFGPYYLVIGQNWNDGWRASIDGRDLGAPLLLDGYSAGWRITQRGSYTVVVRYAPQRGYTFAIGVTVVALLLVGAAIGGNRYRRRRRRRREAA